MKAEILTRWPDVASLGSVWDGCVEQSTSASVFQSFAWNNAWWEAFGADYECRVILVRREGEVVGIAPLALIRGQLGWIGGHNHASDYSDVIVADAPGRDLDAIFSVIADEMVRLPWKSLDFRGVVAASPLLPKLVPALAARGVYPLAHEEVDCPARIFGDPKEDQALLSKKSLKRHFQKMKGKGDFSFTHLEEIGEINSSLDDFFKQHIGRRELANDLSLFQDPRQKRFYGAVASAFLKTGALRFSVVRSQGVAVAYHFGFEWRGKYIWYKPTFHSDFAKESPGEVLLKCLFEHCVARKIGEFDFTVGNEAFKYRFSNLIRRNHRVRAWRNRPTREYFKLRRLAGLLARQVIQARNAWRTRAPSSPKE